MFSIIIPTMWRFAPFFNFLFDLIDHPLVHDIVLIDNDTTRTPISPAAMARLPKLTYLPQEGNLGVNGAWNLGVRHAKTKRLCILNDDLIFDLRLFKRVMGYLNPSQGNIFLCPGNVKDFGQPPVTTGTIDIIPWDRHNRFGYGMMMFVHADNYVALPKDDQMRIYYGDNLLFELPIDAMGKTNRIITNLMHYTPYAATCSSLEDRGSAEVRMENEFRLYQEYKQARMGADIRILNEYRMAADTPGDINLHVPTLYHLALQCHDVVELGVRTGISTRAFLRAAQFGVKLRSVDLELDANVQQLFWMAERHGYPVQLIQHDSRTFETDGCDLLFIDTWHTGEVLRAELNQHGQKVRKFIAFHDTAPDSAGPELWPVIHEFLANNPSWRVEYQNDNNNGLLVLAKEGSKFRPESLDL
jgi:hypothetical protein